MAKKAKPAPPEKPVYSVTARGWAQHLAVKLTDQTAKAEMIVSLVEPIIAKIQQAAYSKGFDDGYGAAG